MLGLYWGYIGLYGADGTEHGNCCIMMGSGIRVDSQVPTRGMEDVKP